MTFIAPSAPTASARRLSSLDRYLTFWIFGAMVVLVNLALRAQRRDIAPAEAA